MNDDLLNDLCNFDMIELFPSTHFHFLHFFSSTAIGIEEVGRGEWALHLVPSIRMSVDGRITGSHAVRETEENASLRFYELIC